MTIAISGFKSHGIREPLTNRIAGILDEYPDGTQIARELLQNSDDARSTVQWYLLDHHSYIDNTDGNNDLELFHEDLKEYMGPALLAGNNSLFEERDFKSMKNLAASEKRNDETKIGQMGIGFNSIYHMTDCPSFISGNQLMIIEPHERIFNGIKSDFNEGAVRGNFAGGGQGLSLFPDQLKAFSLLEDIDFTAPYPGTIFRFPLRTESQATTSKLSSNAYPADKVLEMLLKLKSEALKAMLFLKHIEKISIYERKSLEEGPIKLFEIEIVNAKEVRKERQALLDKLREHVYPDTDASSETILEYSVRPIFKMTQGDGSTTEEDWLISTLVGNVKKSRKYMEEQTDGNLDAHKLIPWVGIAAPSNPGVNIESSGLFCFLPISIQLPFPVHINGHFAVKQSRREIWTNQDNDFARHASAYIKSVWNVHLFHDHVPVVYAKFLTDLELARGPNYDLWPISCGAGIGLGGIWKDLLDSVLRVICKDNLKVFFCEYEDQEHRMANYRSAWIAGRDIDRYPLLVKSLQRLTKVVVGLPDAVLETIPKVINSLDLESRILTPAIVRRLLREHKDTWSSEGVVSSETRIEMLRYCIDDDDIEDLEGLPLLPLAGDLWVEFNVSRADERYLVDPNVYSVLSHSNDGLVDIEFDKYLYSRFKRQDDFHIYWSDITNSVISSKIWDTYDRLLYNDIARTGACMPQPDNGFPTTEWILDFWIMVRSLSNQDQSDLLSKLKGLHLLPTTYQKLAPLSIQQPVVYLDNSKDTNRSTLVPFLKILDDHLDCRVMREDSGNWVNIAASYVFEISDAHKILDILSNAEEEKLDNLDQDHRRIACQYMSQWLSVESDLDGLQLRTLKMLPIYQTYDESSFISIAYHESNQSHWRVVSGFSRSENPWLPKSVELLADGQPMYQHLTGILDVPTMKESGYWFDILENLDQFSEDEWDAIIEKFCGKYHVHCKDHDYRSILIDLPFVRVTGPRSSKDVNTDSTSLSRRSPREIVHPTFSSLFADDEIVFPAGVYAEPSILGVLTEIGIQSTFDGDFIVDRVESLSNHARTSGVNSVKDILQAFYVRLNSSFSDDFSEDIQDTLCEQSWIIANGSSSDQLCYRPMECRPETERALIGSQMPLSEFQFTNKTLIECMGWDQIPPLDKVLANFLSMIEQAKLGSSNGGSEPDEIAFIEIYHYLLKHINDNEALSMIKDALNSQPWILVNGTLHPTDRVTLNTSFDLAPHFVQIRSTGLEKLFLAMGARNKIGQADLEGIISEIASQYGHDESLSDVDVELVVRILNHIAVHKAYWSSKLLVLTQDNRLRPVNEVVYDDLSQRSDVSLQEYDDSYTFVSNEIGYAAAVELHIPLYSARYWNDQTDSTFEPWAQEEDIVARIGNVLNDYDPSNLFLEFLQNAADAGATKCSFMLDERTFGRNKVLNGMAPWQGPALVVYNDAEFSENDFIALSKLGEGNKRDDSSKIGRHGLGFNSVYHFTDVPSVVSGSLIGFFDPLRENLPKVPSPEGPIGQGGQRCNFLRLRGEALSEQLEPYKGLFGCNMKSHFRGTLFRIPLRTVDTHNDSSKKSIINRQWTLLEIHAMLKKWTEDAKVGMLFLENMMNIEITTKSNNPSEEGGFSWSASKNFGTEKPHLDKALREGNDASNFTHVADIRVSSSEVRWRESQKWLIHTDLDYPEGTVREVRDLAKKNRWYTHRGIAIPLNWRSKVSFEGRLFTHLPTPIVTGVPFHIHGGFALTSNRKSLAGEADLTSPQSIWNQFMKLNCLSQTAITAMQKLLKVLFWGLLKGSPKPREIDQATEAYFKFWPVKARPEFESFTKWFSRNTYENPVYPVRVVDQDYHVLFLPGRQVVFPELYGAPSAMSLMIRGYQRKNGVNISECPSAVQTRIRTDWKTDPELNFEALNEDAVRKMIKDDPQFIKKFVKIEDIRWILEYTLKTIMEPTKPVKVPVTGISLLPLMNKTWKPLAPSSGCYTAKAEMRELIHGGEYLIDESIFTTTISSPHTTEFVTVSKLEKIYKRLCGDTIYGLTQLSPAKFTSIFNSENPNGATEDQREKLWRLLDKSKDLEPYGELPILKTSNGDLIPLKYCKNGIEISRLQPQTRRCIEKLSRLMSDLNLVVFDSGQNKRHPYFAEAVPKVDGSTILKCISQRCKDWPEDRVITAEEAEVLREMIRADSVLNSQEAAPLGILRIWPTWGPIGSSNTLRLITARGSFFMEGNYSLEYFGDNSDVIQSNYCKHFAAMGAKSLNIVEAAKSRVIPRFLKKTLTCANRQTKPAYIRMLTDIIKVASAKKGQQAQQAKAFLLADQFILARDGNFHIGRELYDPDDELLASVFMDETSKFPDIQIWQALGSGSKKHLIGLRDRQDPTVIRECALYVLGLTSSHLASSSSSTYIKALALVRHIYQNCGDINWMDPVWRIVPADVTQSSPYNEYIPDMEEYLSFSEIVDPSYRDICWTQCAFFPENLKPTESFKARFPSVGKPRIHSVVNHLQTLVEDLAPMWTSFDHQPILKMSLFKVYKYFDDISKEKGTSTKVALQKELANLTSPYILNGDDKDPSDPESWLWPNQLMLDIDNDIEMHKVVHHKLKSVRGFLVLSGVEQMRTVEGRVEVPEGRRKGDIESRLLNCFESQDMHNGFMDIKFLFADHKQILAHKFMIVHANDYFARRFTGAWAEFTTRDPLNPGVEVIDLSDMDGDETFEAFWGLLYYFYTDNLINTNGPPSPATFEATIQPNVDLLRDRVQYLMGLLCLADQYQTPRLKALIALEIVGGQKVMHSNVFNVRKFAILYNSTDIKDHCEKYVSMNSSSARTYLNGELQVYRQSLNELSGDDDGAQRAELNEDIRELEDNLRDLNTLA